MPEDEEDIPVPPGRKPHAPVKEPPDAPHQEPHAPVKEPGRKEKKLLVGAPDGKT